MTSATETARWRRMKRVLASLGISYLVSPHPYGHVGVLVDRLVAAQEGRCYLCDDPMADPARTRPMPGVKMNPAVRTRDHVIPRCRSGPNRDNQLAACFRCNEGKGQRLPHPCELIYLAAVVAKMEASRVNF